MRKFIVGLLVAVSISAQPQPKAPKLVLAIVVDQFRYDYLIRFRADYTGGLKRLTDQGAVFTNARFEHIPTVSAIGHSTCLTGATPAMRGIVGNEWWDSTTHGPVTSLSHDS